MFIRGYLRASTTQQDASRALSSLQAFADSHNVKIAKVYAENVSGTALERPALDELINDSHEGDILLIEKMDRLTRLPFPVWESLKQRIKEAGINIVVLDQPTTHSILSGSDQVTSAIQQALTNFMLDLGAAMARDDYETRHKRQAEGIQKAKKDPNKYQGRKANTGRHSSIEKLLKAGHSYSDIQKIVGCSRGLIANVKKNMTA
ncbi:TPA: resolvase [Vibrio parahaemolyticus]|uniref:recombinase family protein n=1 Tax=Vibrio TaxID=662 RepID=UPI00112490BC|nr:MULTISPECIES: recombinase family protein [Vibrio]MDF5080289.1 recombinase family protein [Vibrio parahaemolyticus]MDF5100927.1 recombinase family protein [Vibrio parahaemolyticus]MDF5259708.1 recombinase family protein [Vibrio parahaemolyticus]MDW1909326.1 recombinase family protein [Vibrio sp. 707]MDW1920816.1 recombinase family protein [Vibrio sp. 736]